MNERLATGAFALGILILAAIGVNHLLHPGPTVLPKPTGIRTVVLTPNAPPRIVPLHVPPPPQSERFAVNPETEQEAAPAHSFDRAPLPGPPGKPLTAAPGAGHDAFGLGAGSGGGDVIGGNGRDVGGGTGGGGKAGTGFYAQTVAADVRAALMRDDATNSGIYTLVARAWVSPAGQVLKAEIETSSGDAALDRAVLRVLTATTLKTRPPAGLPQPIRMRLTASRG